MPTVLLGNTAVTVPVTEAQAVTHSGDEAPPAPRAADAPELGQQITTIALPESATIADLVAAWTAHSSADPAWVESDDDVLEEQVAEHYGIPRGCPDNGDPDVHNHDTWKEG